MGQPAPSERNAQPTRFCDKHESLCMSLTISVFSDVICPWCLIGKRRLERALDQLSIRNSTTVEWLPFELNPNMPPEGMERARYRAQKFGADRAATLDAHLRELGAAEGISFMFDCIQRTPNTRCAHMLIACAGRQGKADPLVEGSSAHTSSTGGMWAARTCSWM